MKTLKFTYNEAEICFSLDPLDKNVMVNATEMAKVFDKRIDVFLKAEHTKAFIEALKLQFEFPPYGGNSEAKQTGKSVQIIDARGHMGTYFDRRLALKFAAWLNPDFEVWIYSTIDEIMFGSYKQHWQAHARQEMAKAQMQHIKAEILENPTPESVASYFAHEKVYKEAKNAKTNAIRHQLKLFTSDYDD